MSNLSAWNFNHSAEDKSKGIDPFIPRFKKLIETHGFCFPKNSLIPNKVMLLLNKDASQLTEEQWNMTKYPFLDIDKQVIVALQSGITKFSKDEMEALEGIGGDFFDLNGVPRHQRGAPQLSLLAK